jgi:hypothetical protein
MVAYSAGSRNDLMYQTVACSAGSPNDLMYKTVACYNYPMYKKVACSVGSNKDLIYQAFFLLAIMTISCTKQLLICWQL